jgi:sec-independent protein translocase protein TatA
MNIFSNLGITELIIILLLALVVVGPERLPEVGRKLGKTLRDVRKAYENLTRDLGPEFTTIQETTRELRESLDSVRSIPQDMVQSVVKASELEETIGDLKEMAGGVQEIGSTLASAEKVVRDPMKAAVSTAKEALAPPDPTEPESDEPEPTDEQPAMTEPEQKADAHG